MSLLTVSSFQVNEKSNFAIFTVRGAINQVVNLDLFNGTGLSWIDYDANIEIWNGTTWDPYNSSTGLDLGATQKALVRVAIIDDNTYEVSKTFTLKASDRTTPSQFAEGIAEIRDDGTGIIFSNPLAGAGDIYMASPTATNVSELNSSRTTTFALSLGPDTPNDWPGFVQVSSTGATNQWARYTPSVQTALVNLYGESITIPSTYLNLDPVSNSIAREITVNYGITAQDLSNELFTYRYVIGIAGLRGSVGELSTITSNQVLTALGNADVFSTNKYSLFGDGAPDPVSTTPGATGTTITTNTTSIAADGYTFFGIPDNFSALTLTYTGNDSHGFIFGVVALPNGIGFDTQAPKDNDSQFKNGLPRKYWKKQRRDWDMATDKKASFEDFFFGNQQDDLRWGKKRSDCDITFYKALKTKDKWGPFNALAGESVAAVLNSYDEDINYRFFDSQIKDWISDAYGGGTITFTSNDVIGSTVSAGSYSGSEAIKQLQALLAYNNNLGLI